MSLKIIDTVDTLITIKTIITINRRHLRRKSREPMGREVLTEKKQRCLYDNKYPYGDHKLIVIVVFIKYK